VTDSIRIIPLAEALRSWRFDPENSPSKRVEAIQIGLGGLTSVYFCFVALPRSGIPIVAQAVIYGWHVVMIALAIFYEVKSSRYWYQAIWLHFITFTAFLLFSVGYSLFEMHDPVRALMWAFWLPQAWIHAAGHAIGTRKSVKGLFIPWAALALLTVVYLFQAGITPGQPIDDCLVLLPAAMVGCVTQLYMMVTFREHFALSQAVSERQNFLVRESAEREALKSELLATQLELERVNRSLTMSALSASIAHEVNQPLSAIVTNSSAALRWLSHPTPEVEEARKVIESVVSDGLRAGSVVATFKDMLTHSHETRALVDVNGLIEQTLGTVNSEAQSQGVTVLSNLDQGVDKLLIDQVQIRQVILNLVSNALDAMGATVDRPRLLRVCCKKDAGAVAITVSDTGPGIGTSTPDRLFDAFYTTKKDGMGMGLAISRMIVERHGGKLSLTSSSEGTTFRLAIPQH